MKVPFSPPAGLVSDDTTFATGGLWADGSNVRFWRGQAQVIGGWSEAFTEALEGVCRGVRPWTDNAGSPNIAFGTHTKLYVNSEGGLFDITPLTLLPGAEHGVPGPGYGAGAFGDGDYSAPSIDFYPRSWSFGNWGQSLLACPRGDTLFWWQNDTATPAAQVTQAPDFINSILVTPERQVLAFGCNEESSGLINPMCIRGCDIEDLTTWTTASDNNAFEHILEGSGRIVAARLLGAYVAVWTDGGLYLGQFIGQPGQTYRFDRVGDNCGLVGPDAVAIINGVAYWIGPDYQFRRWMPGASPEIIQCPIRRDFKNNIAESQKDKIAASTVSQYGEVWWFYPDERDGLENSRYVAVSTLEGTWFRGKMGRSAACDAGVLGYPLAVTPTGQAFYHEIGESANGSALEWFIQSADQYVGDGQRFMMIRELWPDFEDQRGGVNLTISARKYPQAQATEKGPYTIASDQSKKDLRVSGRVMAIRFAGASNPSFVRFGKSQFDVVATGSK